MTVVAPARALVALTLLLISTPAIAQTASDPVGAAGVRLGPLGLNPSITIRDVGIDTNVFNESEDPKEDVTATFLPQLEALLRLGRARLRVNGAVEALYFKRYTYLRSAEPNGSATLEVRGTRGSVFGGADLRRTRQRTTLEIDERALQTQQSLTVGGDVRLTGKTTVGATGLYSTTGFERDATVAGTSLSQALNRRATTVSAFVRHDLTTLTTVLVRADVQQDRFDESSGRDARRLRITPGVEFKPFALFTGHAVVGYSRLELIESPEEPLTNAFAAIDLAYTLRGRTRFGFQGTRDVHYSFQPEQPYYVVTGFTGSISQALRTSLTVTARAGRQRLDYGQVPGLGAGTAGADIDTVDLYGASVVWRLNPDLQLGVNANQQQRRTASIKRRGYRGLRAGAFLTFGIRGGS